MMAARQPIVFRVRTALYIAAAFSFLLTVYFVISFFSIKDALTTRNDQEVYSQLDVILNEVSEKTDNANFLRLAKEHNLTGEALIGIKLYSNVQPSRQYESYGPLRARQLLDSHTFNFQELPTDIRTRNEIFRVFSKRNATHTIFAAINTLPFEEVYEAMISRYLILLGTGAFVSFLLGLFTADRALKPLQLLIRTAQDIKDESPSTSSLLPTDTRIREINDLAIVINDILQERDRNISALKDFTADAAHELRTPLTILKGELEVDLRIKKLDENDRVSLESNLEEVQRLIHIVEDLLLLARSEQSVQPSPDQEFVSWSLDQLISETCERLRPLIESKKITLSNESNTGTHFIIPKVDIERVFYNILLNAAQYTPQNGSITITSKHSTEKILEVSITDSGIGIASEDLPHIFDRFWRADKSRSRQAGGTGLGLTIAHTLAEHNGVTLRCESTFGVGTTMTCIFPL